MIKQDGPGFVLSLRIQSTQIQSINGFVLGVIVMAWVDIYMIFGYVDP